MTQTFTVTAYEYINSKGNSYYLHGKVVTLRNGRRQQIYYFSKSIDAAFALDAYPFGKRVKETRHGLPVLANV